MILLNGGTSEELTPWTEAISRATRWLGLRSEKAAR
jgi:hypothetical protein